MASPHGTTWITRQHEPRAELTNSRKFDWNVPLRAFCYQTNFHHVRFMNTQTISGIAGLHLVRSRNTALHARRRSTSSGNHIAIILSSAAGRFGSTGTMMSNQALNRANASHAVASNLGKNIH